MNNHIVQAMGLGRDFGQSQALGCVDLSVEAGTILALLGPNGAGKTTLMRLLMGLIEPTRGKTTVMGAPSRKLPALIARSIAYVGDQCEPARWATPQMLAQLQAGAVTSFDHDRFVHFCQQRELAMDKPYGAMSKGQRRWILTSLGLASRPKLILLDEPADGLDPAVRVLLYDQVRDHVNAHDATALITTHVIGDIERIADDVAILDHGSLILKAPLEDLREVVRQVEYPAEQSFPDLKGIATVLGDKSQGDTRLLCIRLHEPGDSLLHKLLGEQAVIRPIGLEALYLAIAQNRSEANAAGQGRP